MKLRGQQKVWNWKWNKRNRREVFRTRRLYFLEMEHYKYIYIYRGFYIFTYYCLQPDVTKHHQNQMYLFQNNYGTLWNITGILWNIAYISITYDGTMLAAIRNWLHFVSEVTNTLGHRDSPQYRTGHNLLVRSLTYDARRHTELVTQWHKKKGAIKLPNVNLSSLLLPW